jgi:hypothetical protein
MPCLDVGIRMGLAHEALSEQSDAKFGFHQGQPVSSFQFPVSSREHEVFTGNFL